MRTKHSEATGWRVVNLGSMVVYWAHDFDDAIKTIGILAAKGKEKNYAVQRKTGAGWTDVSHAL